MKNVINEIFSDLCPQTLGLTDPISTLSILGFFLVVPGVIMFILVHFGRELLRPRWRGYWDAV